jgi:NAD-dependent SIR2 family protein deacetylase
MTLNIGSSCKVSPQNEFLNVLATKINGEMTLNIGSSCKVSPQNEFLNVLATQMT